MADWPVQGSYDWDDNLKAYVDQGGFVSTDASFGLPAPSGVGAEFVIVADALTEIRFNGTNVWTA